MSSTELPPEILTPDAIERALGYKPAQKLEMVYIGEFCYKRERGEWRCLDWPGFSR